MGIPLLTILDGASVKTYCTRDVDPIIVTAPFMLSAQGEAAAEEYVDLTLPWRYREIFWPVNLRAEEVFRKVRPDEIQQREWELEMLHACDRAKAILEGGTEEEVSCRIKI